MIGRLRNMLRIFIILIFLSLLSGCSASKDSASIEAERYPVSANEAHDSATIASVMLSPVMRG